MMLLLGRASLAVLLAMPAAASAQQPAAPVVEGIEGARLVETLPLRGTLYHVQGVELDKEHIWITSVDTVSRKGYLHQFSRRTGELERQIDVSDGPRFHPGGLSLAGNSIWVPVAEYKPDSSAVLLELDRTTLAVRRRISVADHIGCVAVTGDGGLIAGNWSSRKLYVFDSAGKQLRVFANPSSDQFQDIKFADSQLIGSGNITKTTGAVEWYTWPEMKLVRSLRSGTTDRGRLYTAEGMAIQGDDLYVVPEDGPSRIFHFVINRR